jgi:hypothetical protein
MRRAAEVAAPANRFSFARGNLLECQAASRCLLMKVILMCTAAPAACKSRHCQSGWGIKRIDLPGIQERIFFPIRDYLLFSFDADYL